MGTETIFLYLDTLHHFHYHVKLNNPQMGTETLNWL